MKLLTWNIQAAIGTGRYLDYFLRVHRQLIHTSAKTLILHDIAREIAPHDLVCLQEVDLGGRRAGYRSQADQIALLSGHPHVVVQENRTVRGVSRHGNAILSRWPLTLVEDIKLPGRVPGRGCLVADLVSPRPLRVACLHLSLGDADRVRQLAVVAEALRGAGAWAAMGDFNCRARSPALQTFCEMTGGRLPPAAPETYPSWQPRQDFDHIVSGGDLSLADYRSEPIRLSDHLPLSAMG